MSQVSITSQRANLDQTAAPVSEDSPLGTGRGFLKLLHVRKLMGWRDPARYEGAGDREQRQFSGPLGKLQAEDVRWDLIGASGTGRRYRI